jgi:hypothetical protein
MKKNISHLVIATPLILLSLVGCKKQEASFYPCEPNVFFYALMMAESSGNPKTRFVESNGEVSGGLYQVSVGDAGRYGCNFKTEADLYDPVRNTDCRDKIIKKLRERYPTEAWDESLARYWGTLRSKAKWPDYHKRYPNHRGYINFQYYAKQKGCVIP